MALSEKHIDEIVALYDGGAGDTLADLASAYPSLSKAAIIYHLKQRGVYRTTPRTEKTTVSVSNQSSDEDLGIGEEDTPTTDLAALLANPALAKLIDEAVAARVAQLAGPAVIAASPQTDAFTAAIEMMKHMIDAQSEQLPGYIKPLPAEELDRRASGRVEMFALLEDYERRGMAPLWTVGESGFVECTNMQEFNEGEQIRTYLPPVEDFIPENEAAEKVHAAMMRWLGGATPEIGEQVKQAHLNSKLPPLITGSMEPDRRASPVERVQSTTGAAPVKAGAKRRTMGTIVPERRDVTPGARSGEATGPAFTEAA